MASSSVNRRSLKTRTAQPKARLGRFIKGLAILRFVHGLFEYLTGLKSQNFSFRDFNFAPRLRVATTSAGLFLDDKVAKTSNLDMFSAYYQGMRERGIYIAPSQFEAGFVSSSHTKEDIDNTINAAAEVFGELRK